MVKISELKRFDITEHLDSEEAIAEYLSLVLEENDLALLAAAAGDITKARGMTQVAKDSGWSRESLYKSLGGGAIPRFDALSKVINVLGVKLVAMLKPANTTL